MAELIQDLNKSEKTETEGAHGPESAKPEREKHHSHGARQNDSLTGHLTKIAEHVGAEGLDPFSLEAIAPHLNPVAKEFGISHVQAALLAQFLDRYYDQNIGLGEIAASISCSRLEFLRYQDDLDALENKKLVRCRRGEGSISYRVPDDLIEALRKGEHFQPPEHRNLPLAELLETTEALFDQRTEGELSYKALVTELRTLIDLSPALGFSQKITNLKLSEEDFVPLMYFCCIFAHYHNDHIWLHPFQGVYEDKSSARKNIGAFLDGDHGLLRQGLAAKEIADEDEPPFSLDSSTFKLTGRAKKELLGELKLKQRSKGRDGADEDGITSHKTIKPKTLFYNEGETAQISKLAAVLRDDAYKTVCKRLAAKGMRTGFACLFSGPPGTGKTETAYQLARETRRDIMKVDIPRIIGSYVGESEKNIKEQFDRYRAAVKSRRTAPILFFNEADALITRRMELSSHNPSVERMWNAMQNIILEEMETLNGILIAATNMKANLDKAFDRRFLFKIEFGKPNLASRRSIWQTLIPELSPASTENLATRFDFSGGQIENVARKYVLEGALSGRDPGLDEIAAFCKEELEKGVPGNIGFAV